DWYAEGGTCICCGINNAADRITSDSNESRAKAIVVMSDGEANYECSEQDTGDPKQDAIQAACDAYQDHDIKVHSIGFGDGADEETLKDIADCGNGNYNYSNVSNIAEIYNNVAENIIEASYEEQTINTSDEVWTKLYPDSYIEFDYEKRDLPYGLFITSESQNFNSSSMTDFYVPENSTVVNARSTSYSGSKWTQSLEMKNETWDTVYNLSEYNQDYIELGDPYIVDIPPEKTSEGTNKVKLETGLSPSNASSASDSDKIIYTIIKDALGYSSISSTSIGCNWTIEFYDSTNMTMDIPKNNRNTEECYYTSKKTSYDKNDAIATATYDLLKSLDFDSDNRVDSKFSKKDMDIQTSGITGIPYTYGTEIQMRVWR
ncbi:MAG: VWA domain-containing protein, partial [Bacteroidales bacterium]